MTQQSPPPPLPYQTPPAHVRGPGVFDWNTFVRAALLVAVFVAIMLLVVPRFEDTFRDFRIELPATTKALLAISRVTAGGWWLILLAIPPGLAFLVAQFGPVGRRIARSMILLALGGLVLFVALGVFQPMLTLIDGMNSKK